MDIVLFATMRDLSKAEKVKKIVVREHLPLKVLQMDVNECGSVKEAIKKIIEDEE